MTSQKTAAEETRAKVAPEDLFVVGAIFLGKGPVNNNW